MRAAEIRVMLEYLRAFEPYLETTDIAVAAWSDALIDAIDSTWARKVIAHHYSRPDAARMTPGLLNNHWRNSNAPDAALLALEDASTRATPMPQWLKQQIQELADSKRVDA